MATTTIRMVKGALHELASHVYVLATGLQNAAPPGAIPVSVQYLLEAAAMFEHTSNNIETLLADSIPNMGIPNNRP
jgi:hypothetical protein